jgi:hypothetical protein
MEKTKNQKVQRQVVKKGTDKKYNLCWPIEF